MVGRIGKHARLQADGVALAIGAAVLADEGAVQEVAGIELDARRGDADFHHPARHGIFHDRGGAQRARLAVDDEIVVIAAAIADLLVAAIADAVAHPVRGAEIERGARHRSPLAGGNQGGTDRGEAGGVQRDHIAHHVARVIARQVEIAVVGQVQHRGLAGRGFVLQPQLVVFVQCVGRGDLELAGKAFLAIGADVAQHHLRVRPAGDGVDLPHPLVEAPKAPMQRVRPVIGGERIGLAVQGELALGNAVGIASHRRAEIVGMAEIFLGTVIAQGDVGLVTGLVGHDQRLQRGAKGHDLRRHAVPVGQGHRLDLRAVGQLPERCARGGGGIGTAGGQRQKRRSQRQFCDHMHVGPPVTRSAGHRSRSRR